MKQTMIDPVCGMQVDPATSAHTLERDGVRYTFCCGGCLKAFKADLKPIAAKPTGSCCCHR